MLSYKGLYIEYVDNLPEDSADRGLYPVDGNPVAMQMPLARAFEGRLLKEWWETHPAAGPPEGLAGDDAPPVAKPTLRICAWKGEVPEVLPEAAMKFNAGSDTAEE